MCINVPDNPPKSDWKPYQYQAAAHMLGYDPNKLTFRSCIPNEWKGSIAIDHDDPERLSLDVAMVTDMTSGEITILPSNVPLHFERGILAHEIFHVCFASSAFAVSNEVEQYDKTGIKGKLMERFEPTLGNPRALGDITEVSEYATYFMKLLITKSPNVDLPSTISEILSEMARVYEMTGELPNTPIWKKLYKDVQCTAIELGVIKRLA